MTRYELVATRPTEDVARLYGEARVAGLGSSHYPTRKCHVLGGSPKPGTALGGFRLVGALIFYKKGRRWEVRDRN